MASAQIVYASMTGNTQEIAEIVEEALSDLGVDTQITEMTQAVASDFEQADICVVAAYTFSDGGPGLLPEEADGFVDELQELDLSGKVYGVCGSGDTFYDDFATAVDMFDAAFAKTGAKRGADDIKVDLAAEADDIDHLEKFAADLLAASGK
ncbi:flavodoxin [Lacticaseibacillus pabuli]|uniref:Flavodoxin n=1 Tax=Lacticaseibacillus pabuli TaxID=3025672 RepID=A0ABY7WX03_9LACO|nr:flavodoxin [Lacticaseibacillus sp. KACC 23028]WDF83482.1 flavodoxin [Lacticaseibacillus sp. KACC 23028]